MNEILTSFILAQAGTRAACSHLPGALVPAFAGTRRNVHHVSVGRLFYLVDVGIGQAEMMADLVNQHVGDDGAERLVVLGPVQQDRHPVEPDHVWHLAGFRDRLERQSHALKQPEEIEFALYPHVIEDVFGATGYSAADIDWFVPHQANQRILDGTARKLGIKPERVISTIAEHGNTSAASIPLAISVAVEDGRVKKGDLVLLEAMGGGFTWGSALLRW